MVGGGVLELEARGFVAGMNSSCAFYHWFSACLLREKRPYAANSHTTVWVSDIVSVKEYVEFEPPQNVKPKKDSPTGSAARDDNPTPKRQRTDNKDRSI